MAVRKGYRFERCRAKIHWMIGDNVQKVKRIKDGVEYIEHRCRACGNQRKRLTYQAAGNPKVWHVTRVPLKTHTALVWGSFLPTDPREFDGIP